jgi:hypothetical protein
VRGSSIIVSSRTASPAYPKSFGRRATVHADLCEVSPQSHKNVITPPMTIFVAECFFLQEIRHLRGS